MEIKKTLDQISLNVTESQYREDPALSYSTLARYEREGFDNLDTLFDQISTPSLTQGSMVDSLITGGEDEFNERFYVADFPSLGDKECHIADLLFEKHSKTCAGFSAIPKNDILAAANQIGFYGNWKDDTRVKALTERCSSYYNLKYLAGEKTIVSTDTYNKVLAMVNVLKESPATAKYFMPDSPFDDIRRYYQLKFKATLEGVEYRCMADLIVVDYANKVIIPVDLKTSGKPEWHFEDSFRQWNYVIQSRLYWRIIRDNLDKDEYFKDFELLDYRFIVVNKESLTPLIWTFPGTELYGTFVDENGTEYRDPFIIGSELRNYLDTKPAVPMGIDVDGINIINCLKLKDNLS